MISRFIGSAPGKRMIKDPKEFEGFMMNEYRKYNYNYVEKDKEEYEIDKIIGKQIMTHLQDFFNMSNNKTKKRNKNIRNRTFKKK
jgi:hypothetical protein